METLELTSDSKLVQNLLLKRDLLSKEDQAHKRIRPALLILGGGMRGASGAGVAHALHTLGLSEVFEVVVGISTGAPIAAYFLAGEKQLKLGASIYYEDLPTKFIRYLRNPVVDIDFLERLFRTGPKKLDIAAIKRHRSEFLIAVTKAHNGQGILIDAKKAPDMIAAIKASTALPGLYNQSVEVDHHPFIDGGVGIPFPAREILQKFDITDLLVITNRSLRAMLRKRCPLLERMLTPLALCNTSPEIREQISRRQLYCREALEHLESSQINWGIICSPVDDRVKILTRNARKLRELAQLSAQKTLGLFGKQAASAELLT